MPTGKIFKIRCMGSRGGCLSIMWAYLPKTGGLRCGRDGRLRLGFLVWSVFAAACDLAEDNAAPDLYRSPVVAAESLVENPDAAVLFFCVHAANLGAVTPTPGLRSTIVGHFYVPYARGDYDGDVLDRCPCWA